MPKIVLRPFLMGRTMPWVFLTISGKVLRMNRRALQLVQAEKENALGKSLWGFSLWSEELREVMQDGVRQAGAGGRARFEFHHEAVDAVMQWQLSIGPIENSAGDVTGLIFEGHDTSEVRSLQSRLHQREKWRRLGSLLAGWRMILITCWQVFWQC